MRHWWVNQNQTYRHEIAGGYLWSPKRNANNARNQFYDFMRDVAPGDVVFSFAGTYIRGIGIVVSNAYEAPKPLEFGQAGAYWNQIGWRVDVRSIELKGPIRPAEHMERLAPLLPKRYSPLQANGSGLQGVYLTYLPDPLAAAGTSSKTPGSPTAPHRRWPSACFSGRNMRWNGWQRTAR
jgi:hypothetical protein